MVDVFLMIYHAIVRESRSLTETNCKLMFTERMLIVVI